jgi:tetrahydromethanopterin S-methyltransferase subunit G
MYDNKKERIMEFRKKEQPIQQQIEIDLGTVEGVYSNLALITHSPAEFIIDFCRILPGMPKAKVVSRVIMTPQHAKLLMKALEDNIKKFEERFGEVKLQTGEEGKNIGFKVE